MIGKFRVALLALFLTFMLTTAVFAWSNGGFSFDVDKPKFGTHDWIALKALDWQLGDFRKILQENIGWYLYGTELPDNPNGPYGIGDVQLHHVYFASDGNITDGSAAKRANETFYTALNHMINGNFTMAALYAGVMTHYIADVACFGHVMGDSTAWGEEKHHYDYEVGVDDLISEGLFERYLLFDGDLIVPPITVFTRSEGSITIMPEGAGSVLAFDSRAPAYWAAINVAKDATFDSSGRNLTCKWMDENYNWSNPSFVERTGQLLNKAVNMVADALHTLYVMYLLGGGTNYGAVDFRMTLTRFENASEIYDVDIHQGDVPMDKGIVINGTSYGYRLFIFLPYHSSINYSFPESVTINGTVYKFGSISTTNEARSGIHEVTESAFDNQLTASYTSEYIPQPPMPPTPQPTPSKSDEGIDPTLAIILGVLCVLFIIGFSKIKH